MRSAFLRRRSSRAEEREGGLSRGLVAGAMTEDVVELPGRW